MSKKLTDEHIKVLMAAIQNRLNLVLNSMIDNLPSLSKDQYLYRPDQGLAESFRDIVIETIEIAEIMYCSASDSKLKSDIREFIFETQNNITIIEISPNKRHKSHAKENN